MLRDSRSYEVQIIDAVRSVNKALGGTYGTSSAIYKNEFNQYEVQLIDAIKGIARTISGHGFSLVGGGEGASSEALLALSQRVSKLESESFFRLVNGNVTLKEQYQNLWVPGWLAAGGIGNGSGGGGATLLSQLEDVSINTTTLADGHVLTWDATAGESGMWVNKPNSGGGGDYIPLSGSTSITGTLGASNWSIATNGVAEFTTIQGNGSGSGAKLKLGHSNNSSYVWIQEDTYVANVGLSGGTSSSSASYPTWEIPSNGAANFASVSVTGGTSSGFLKADGSVDTNSYLSSASLYIGYTSVQNTDNPQAQYLFGIPYINATNSASSKSRMIWDSTNEAWHFYGNIYADGWVAAGGIGSGGGGGGGGSYYAGTGINIDSSNYISLKTASTSQLGGVKVDGTTITISNGVISASGGGGGGGTVTSVAMTVPTGLSVSGTPITSSGTLAVSLASGYVIPQQATLDNFVTLNTTQEISGAKTFKDHDVTFTASSGLSLHQSSHIDIGPIRIMFENNALHITKKNSSDTNNYGIYADGFVAAGGVGQTS